MTSVGFRPAAVEDLEDAQRWYARQRFGLGEEFLEAVDTALTLARAHPRAFPVVHRDTRRVFLRRFPFALYYRLVGDRMVVVACFHAKRDPSAWRQRRRGRARRRPGRSNIEIDAGPAE